MESAPRKSWLKFGCFAVLVLIQALTNLPAGAQQFPAPANLDTLEPSLRGPIGGSSGSQQPIEVLKGTGSPGAQPFAQSFESSSANENIQTRATAVNSVQPIQMIGAGAAHSQWPQPYPQQTFPPLAPSSVYPAPTQHVWPAPPSGFPPSGFTPVPLSLTPGEQSEDERRTQIYVPPSVKQAHIPSESGFLQTGGEGLDRHWLPPANPIRVYVKPGNGIPRYKDDYFNMVMSCAQEWEKASGGTVKFVQVDKPYKAHIQVEWVAYCRDVGAAEACGLTKYNATSNGYIVRARIFLATTMPDRWKQGVQTPHTMRQTILHELGHALGFSHSARAGDIMYCHNLSRMRFLVEGVLPVNIPLPVRISGNDKRRLRLLYPAAPATALQVEPSRDDGAKIETKQLAEAAD